MRGFALAAVAIGVALAACGETPLTVVPTSTGTPETTVAATGVPPTATPVGVSESDVLNGTYPDLNAGTVALRDGRWSLEYQLTNATGVTLTVREAVTASRWALGDIDRDDLGDAVVVLAFDGGGSGLFMRLVPVLYSEGRAVPGARAVLGDRVNVRTVTINDAGTVRLDAVVHRIGDPLCCPTLPLVLEFVLEDGVLRWRNPEVCAEVCADPIGGVR